MVEAGDVQKPDAVDRLRERGLAVGISEEDLQTGLSAAFSPGPPRETAEIISIAPHGAAVLAQVRAFLSRFISYPSPEAHTAHVLWCVHAHRMDLWDSTPRISFHSPEPGSGKTRALEITELLVPRPICAVNMSTSALFRCVVTDDGLLPTIILDEVDALFGAKAKSTRTCVPC